MSGSIEENRRSLIGEFDLCGAFYDTSSLKLGPIATVGSRFFLNEDSNDYLAEFGRRYIESLFILNDLL